MKRTWLGILGIMVISSLWAENIGSVTVFGGYNAWVLGQLATSELDTISNGRTEGGGFTYGGEVLVGDRERLQFGLEVSWQPLLTISAKHPATGQTVTVGYGQIPILVKAVSGGSGFYGDVGLGISFVSAYGDKDVQTAMELLFPDAALTAKLGGGFRMFFNEWIGLHIGANTTVVFGDYGMFNSLPEKPPIWLNMILFWQMGLRAGVSVYF